MSDDQQARLPHFIFGRLPEIEREGGFTLAGMLVTDIPKTKKRPSKRDQMLIKSIIEALTDNVVSDPHMHEAGIWRGGRKPADGASTPFDDELMRKRVQRCIVIAVRIDPSSDTSRIKLDSDLLRQMGLGRDGRLLQ
jgi:hypothetical protein